jgi:acyl-CoA dehydrogenase
MAARPRGQEPVVSPGLVGALSVDFEFSEEQEALREQVRRLFADGLSRARALLDSKQAYDEDLWRGVVEMGLPAAAVPTERGGLGLGPLELCVIAEELGRSLAPIPFASSVLQASEALKIAGDDSAWLSRLAGGSGLGTVAFCEGRGSWATPPEAVVSNGLLSGVKQPVADHQADMVIVSARSAEDGAGYGWWLVEKGAPGMSVSPTAAVDLLRPFATLSFDGTPARRLGEPGTGASMMRKLWDRAAILTSFEQLGGAQAVLDACIEHAKTRKTFGNAIGAYQAVKHRIVDIFVKVELARGHCYYGAWALGRDAEETALAAAGARLAATEAFSYAAEEAIELHGGIGFTWESELHLFYRRARLLASVLGAPRRSEEQLVNEVERHLSRSPMSHVHGL